MLSAGSDALFRVFYMLEVPCANAGESCFGFLVFYIDSWNTLVVHRL